MVTVRPSHVFILGRAGAGFAAGFYWTGYPIFLWQAVTTLSDRPAAEHAGQWMIAIVIASKYAMEAVFEILSTAMADVAQRCTRESVFLIGFGLQSLGFTALVIAPLLLKNHLNYAVLALFIMEALRASGEAFVSGAFDGWAVTEEKALDRNFDKTQLFAVARTAERLFVCTGAIVVILLFSANWFGGAKPGGRHAYFWATLWALPLLSNIIIWVLLTVLSRRARSSGTRRTHAKKPGMSQVLGRFRLAASIAFQRRAVPSWLFLANLYTVAMVVGFTWPVVADNLEIEEPYLYMVPLFLFVTGFVGSVFAQRLSEMTGDARRYEYARNGVAVQGVVCLLIGIVLFVPWTFPILGAIFGLALLAGTRFVDYATDPFVDSLIHDDVGNPEVDESNESDESDESDESLRAAVVSFRNVGSNSLVALVFVAYSLSLDRLGSSALGLVYMVLSVLTLGPLLYFRRSIGRVTEVGTR